MTTTFKDARILTSLIGEVSSPETHSRVVRGLQLLLKNHVITVKNEMYVKSGTEEGVVYKVESNHKFISCTCLDYQRTGQICKHGAAVMLAKQFNTMNAAAA